MLLTPFAVMFFSAIAIAVAQGFILHTVRQRVVRQAAEIAMLQAEQENMGRFIVETSVELRSLRARLQLIDNFPEDSEEGELDQDGN